MGQKEYDEYMHLWLDLVPEYARQQRQQKEAKRVSTTMTFGQAVAALTSLNQAGITTATIRPRSRAGQKEGTKDTEGKPLYYAVDIPTTSLGMTAIRSLYTPADVEAYINEVVPLVVVPDFATYQFHAPDGSIVRNQAGGTYWDLVDLRRCNFTTTHKGRTVKLSVPAVAE